MSQQKRTNKTRFTEFNKKFFVTTNGTIEKTDGEYGEERFVYQRLFELPCFDNNYPVIVSLVIGQEAAGIGIREANNLISDNKSRFVPHLIS